MLKKNNFLIVIPARKGSKRLKNKNIYKVNKKPMICWSIEAAIKSKFCPNIIVSSDCSIILEIAKKYDVITLKRPKILAKDHVPKLLVVRHAVKKFIKKFKKKPKYIISLQANSPQVKKIHIDNAINHLINFNLNEVISVDKNLNQDSAIRVMKFESLFQKSLSVHVGCVITNLVDVHKLKDIKTLNNEN
jgi:CMP-N,N'-diacetyllegionaminic acid synthase